MSGDGKVCPFGRHECDRSSKTELVRKSSHQSLPTITIGQDSVSPLLSAWKLGTLSDD